MKKVFTVFVLFLLVSFVCDRLLGVVLHKAFTNSNSIENFVYQKCDADVIILGSSRAKHHYVPSIISDSLGMSCYNLGEDGKNIYYQYANLNLLLTHHKPKLVIYDCFSIDVMKADFQYDFGSLSDMYPLYGVDSEVDRMIEMQGLQYVSRIVVSHLYRYNTRFLDFFTNRFNPNDKNKGYDPLSGVYNKQIAIHHENENFIIDSMKIEYMQKLIDLCRANDIALFFAVSPRFALNENEGEITKKYEGVKDLCDKNSIAFLYYELSPSYLQNGALFKDIGHLNNEGAVTYTQEFTGSLKQRYY